MTAGELLRVDKSDFCPSLLCSPDPLFHHHLLYFFASGRKNRGDATTHKTVHECVGENEAPWIILCSDRSAHRLEVCRGRREGGVMAAHRQRAGKTRDGRVLVHQRWRKTLVGCG